jgi:uncharacterized membrane protein
MKHESDSRTLSALRIENEDGTIVELPDETIDALTSIALRNSLSYHGAIQQAIVNEKFLLDLEASGYQLLLQKGRRTRHVERH